MKHNQSQMDNLFEHPLRELLGLDKELRSIRGLLKVEVPKKIHLEKHIEWEKHKLAEIENPLEYGDGQHEEIGNRIERLNDDFKARQESINLLMGRLMNQITSFKETIAKVLDKDTSLAEKIRMLFREQGITIAYSQLLEWLSVFWLKHCDQVGVVQWLKVRVVVMINQRT